MLKIEAETKANEERSRMLEAQNNAEKVKIRASEENIRKLEEERNTLVAAATNEDGEGKDMKKRGREDDGAGQSKLLCPTPQARMTGASSDTGLDLKDAVAFAIAETSDRVIDSAKRIFFGGK
jgi:hypothetical protein